MKRIWLMAFIAALILSVVVDLLRLSGQGHDGFAWSHILGFFALFGFVSCVVIVVISRLIGHYWLQRKEDYYDRDSNGDE